jgi:hypothetical protein
MQNVPILHIGRASQGVTDNQAVVSLLVELPPGLVPDRHVLQRDSGLEGELGDVEEILPDQSGIR